VGISRNSPTLLTWDRSRFQARLLPESDVMQDQEAPRIAETSRALVKAIQTLAGHLAATRPGSVYREVLALVEGPLLAHVLALTEGNQVRAARLLGVNRNTLHKRGRQLGLLPGPERPPGARQPGSAA
jgi:DNA-binding protein Fis